MSARRGHPWAKLLKPWEFAHSHAARHSSGPVAAALHQRGGDEWPGVARRCSDRARVCQLALVARVRGTVATAAYLRRAGAARLRPALLGERWAHDDLLPVGWTRDPARDK